VSRRGKQTLAAGQPDKVGRIDTERLSARPAGADRLVELLARPRFEVFPAEGIERDVAEHVPTSVKVTVTSSPSRGLDATLSLTERLAKLGFQVVPHLAARLVVDRSHLRQLLERLDASGVREAFVVGGDSVEPAGDFSDALSLLQAVRSAGHGFDEIGITGYPESHPQIGDEQLMQATLDKAPLATYVVSQVCFDPKAIAEWIAAVRTRGVGLPIYVGIPGIVQKSRLLRIATQIGVGESRRFLTKHGNWAMRLIRPRAYTPDRLIDQLRSQLEDPEAGIDGFHVYTLNGIARTEAWRRAKLERAGSAR
jgi:methylenetetrahydrofolate reductase (NADPH)